MIKTPTGLKPKHDRFVHEWLIDQNATQAAIRAGFAERSARVMGSRLLARVDVKAVIDARLASDAAARAGTAEWIVEKAIQVVDMAIEQKNLGAATSTLALLAKRWPDFSEKRDIQLNERVEAIHAFAELPIEAVRALARGESPSLLSAPQPASGAENASEAPSAPIDGEFVEAD